MSLNKQCAGLGIALKDLALEYNGRTEDAVLSYFKKQGFIGTTDEGYTFKTSLKALILDELHKVNIFNDRSDACVRYLEAQMEIHKDITKQFVDISSKVRKGKFKKNIKEISGHPYIREAHSGLSIEMALQIYKHVKPKILSNLLAQFCEDPYGYRSGWPDLTIGNRNGVELGTAIGTPRIKKLH